MSKYLILGLLLSRQVFSLCDFKITEGRYFSKEKRYGVKVIFQEACSSNSFYKRNLASPVLEIYDKEKLVSKILFSEGYWLESSRKFYFKNSQNKNCAMKNLTVNLEEKYMTSLSGAYLNFESGNGINWKCDK